ncbi:RND transporter [Chitinophaga sp. MD30]|nr:RND transporter [Chitinophaga sp. MD30]
MVNMTNLSTHILFRVVLTVSIAAGIAGCRTQQPLQTPPARPLPDAFQAAKDSLPIRDTNSIADIPWKQFFRDEPLQQLIDTALQRNFDLGMALQRIEKARATALAARNAWLPSVDISATASADKYGDYTLNGVGNFDTNFSPNISKDQQIPTSPTPDYFLGLRSSWEIDVWGKLKSQRKAAVARYLSSFEDKRLVTTMLVAEVANLYYQLVALDQELDIIHKNILLQESALYTVQVQQEAGRTTLLAVQQTAAQLTSTRSLEFVTKQQITAAENQLNALMGRFPQPIARSHNIPDGALPAQLYTGIPSAMLLRRPDIRQAELELAAARSDVQAARAAFLPSLHITPYAGFNAFAASLLFQTPASLAYGILGSITAPLFNKKQLQAQYLSQTADGQHAFLDYQQKIVTAFREVSTSLHQVENQRQVYNLKTKETQLLQEAVSTSKDLFMGGYASYLEVITAQKSVLEAELALISSRRDMFIGTITLYRSLGGGWK